MIRIKLKVSAGGDKKGNEIEGYIVQKAASFKGGPDAWLKYLQKNLKTSIPADAGVDAGSYTTIVAFEISKVGYISNVKVNTAPANCKPCVEEALRVVRDGPEWEPAIFNNEPVIFQQLQAITFDVVEGKKAKKH